MRSLSDILIKKREERGLTISQVSYETNISQKYIVALEEEDFDIFPAEAYLLGFLRNYSEFLGLEYENVVAEYKNCIVREEPTPLSELMGMKKAFVFKPWMIIVTVLIFSIIFGVPPVLRVVKSQIERRKEMLRKEMLRLSHEEKSKIFQIDEDFSGKKIKESDTLTLMIGNDKL
ncbi:MAG: hypothetical protein B6229_10640 [Spirochaetaceae bacterium 4572_7]|nr:MAG: hypothetical protein B6229_10640 [Spirochaetaceae bacterium 4572_7]